MDTPTNLMVINGVMLFDEVIDFEAFASILQERLVDRYDRFRQRLIESPPGTGRLHWEDDPYFDIRSHIRHFALPAPGNINTLQRLISELMSGPLERNAPMWRFYLIENVEGGCAIFGRIHHCIADGIALIQVLLSLTDESPAPSAKAFDSQETGIPVVNYEEGESEHNFSLFSPVFKLTSKAMGMASQIAKAALTQGFQTWENPTRLIEIAQSTGLLTAASAAILTKLLLLPSDRQSVFKGKLGAMKKVVWSDPLDLNVVKQIGKSMNATVNDVLVAAVAGALRRYLQAHGDTVSSGDMRAMVPVNLRNPKAGIKLGNQFALVYLNLPVSLPEPEQRLLAVKRQMDVLKSSPEPMLVYQLLNIIGMLPGAVADQATTWFSTKASMVLTNVPGPRQPLYFAGKAMDRVLFWVPQSGEIGLGISIISYNGFVTLGIVVDESLAPDPERILDTFKDEFESLAQLSSPES
ncbi:MAG: wax ester/triacylglycerol synthase family O-acyltransferase [Caldilineaceae bacterium]